MIALYKEYNNYMITAESYASQIASYYRALSSNLEEEVV
jgi:hypothetical protein